MDLHMDMIRHRNILVARLVGELDHHTADKIRILLEDAIGRGDCRHLVLSLDSLQFMDSSGIGVILGRYKQIKHKGGKMVICGVNPQVYRLLEMSGLFKIMAVYENEAAALTELEVAL